MISICRELKILQCCLWTKFQHVIQFKTSAFPARDCSNKILIFTYFMSPFAPYILEYMPSFLVVFWNTHTYLRSLEKTHPLTWKEGQGLSNLIKKKSLSPLFKSSFTQLRSKWSPNIVKDCKDGPALFYLLVPGLSFSHL